MKHVLRRIMARKRAFSEHSIFRMLKDASIPARQRLAFIPAMAHFIMSFRDLNRLVLRFPTPSTELEEAVNAHTIEDETHWVWYLEDLTALQLDSTSSKTATLRELWSDDTVAARNLTYRLVGLLKNTNAAERLAIIEVMEETGNVMFSALAPIGRSIRASEGLALTFCSDIHLAHETGHVMNIDHALLAGLKLSEAERSRALELVEAAFDAFDEFAEELSRHAARCVPRESVRARAVGE